MRASDKPSSKARESSLSGLARKNEDIENVLISPDKVQAITRQQKAFEAHKRRNPKARISSRAEQEKETTNPPANVTSPTRKRTTLKQRAPKPPVIKEKKKPSKYMQEIFRLNFVELANKLDKAQKEKRIQALATVRRHMASRFMKLYKAFRNKKFGEPFDPKEEYQWPKDKAPAKEYMRDPILGDLEDINDLDMLSEYPSPMKERQGDIESKLAALEKLLNGGSAEKRKINEDLDTVREE